MHMAIAFLICFVVIYIALVLISAGAASFGQAAISRGEHLKIALISFFAAGILALLFGGLWSLAVSLFGG